MGERDGRTGGESAVRDYGGRAAAAVGSETQDSGPHIQQDVRKAAPLKGRATQTVDELRASLYESQVNVFTDHHAAAAVPFFSGGRGYSSSENPRAMRRSCRC